jgi:Zn-dependent protease
MFTKNKSFGLDLDELISIITSLVAICLSLTISTFGFKLNAYEFFENLFLFALAVGPGFVFHELAHKFSAIRYGFYAKFYPWIGGLVLMLGLAFVNAIFSFNFLFLAPGAVKIFSNKPISKSQSGIISLAGPITNILLAIVFFVLGVLIAINFVDNTSGADFLTFYFFKVCVIGFKVNLFLAFFNLLPIFPLDGAKVFSWNKIVWGILFLISLLSFVL